MTCDGGCCRRLAQDRFLPRRCPRCGSWSARPGRCGGQGHLQVGIVKIRAEELGGKFLPVTGQPRELEGAAVTFGLHRRHGDRIHGLRLRGRLRLRGEVERNPQDVGIFDREPPFGIRFVGLSAQRPADHLLAKQLGAEGAHAQKRQGRPRAARLDRRPQTLLGARRTAVAGGWGY